MSPMFKNIVLILQICLNLCALLGYVIAIIPFAYYMPVLAVPGFFLVFPALLLNFCINYFYKSEIDVLENWNLRFSLLVFVPFAGYMAIAAGILFSTLDVVNHTAQIYDDFHQNAFLERKSVIYVEKVASTIG